MDNRKPHGGAERRLGRVVFLKSGLDFPNSAVKSNEWSNMTEGT